jgi:aspartate/methionine/tyrosine aminotransferase
MKEYKFCWGEPYCIRDALKSFYKNKTSKIDTDLISYQVYEGNPELINKTRDFIKNTTGTEYKFIVITQGTTGAINIVLRSLQRKFKYDKCATYKYYFPYYPSIINKNNYRHIVQKTPEFIFSNDSNTLNLIDSPSNPTGNMFFCHDAKNSIIWDSVYHNPVFVNNNITNPEHRVNCGSYSKAFGLTGARIGWIATNDETDYAVFKDENMYENCSISYLSQSFVLDVLINTDTNAFMRHSKHLVNNNREMFHKISYMFDNQPVPDNGMYYAAWADPHTNKLLNRLNIKSIKLDVDAKYEYLRFNLAQINAITNKAVKLLIKEDNKL